MTNDIQDIFELAAPAPNNALRDNLWASVLRESATEDSVASATIVDEVDVLQLQPRLAKKNRRPIWFGAIAAGLILVLGVGIVMQGRTQSRVFTSPTAPPTSTTTATSVSSTDTTVATTSATTTEAPVVTTLAPTTTSTALPLLAVAPGTPAWENLPSSGLPTRVAALVVNAGNRVLVVGGQKDLYATKGSATYQGPATRTDGAMLDLATKTWAKIAPSPVPLNNLDVAQWDGQEVITLAADGSTSAFDPAKNTWRNLARASLNNGAEGRRAAWTGSELLVMGGYDPSQDPTDPQTPALRTAAYRPDTNTWRTIKSPSVGLGPTTLWTGTKWLAASGPYRQSVQGSEQLQAAETYDPKTNAWSKVPSLPGNNWIVQFGRKGDAIVAANGGGSIWELDAAGTWRSIAQAHMGDSVSVISLSYVDGHPVVYADSGGTNGSYLGYGQASSAWVGFAHSDGAPKFGVVVPLLTETGQLFETDGTNASMLAPIVDPTVNVAPCTAKDVDAKATGGDGNAVITLTNHTTKPCTINGQRPALVILNGPGHGPLPQAASPFYHRSLANNGGLIEAGRRATIDVFAQQDPAPDGKPCPVKGTVDSIAFSLSEDADRITVPITLPEGCWDMQAIDAALG